MAKGKNKNNKNKGKKNLPFVSVCTPTFNRRPFINRHEFLVEVLKELCCFERH